MKREDMMSLGNFREQFSRFPDDARVFFGCPDEANPLEFVEVEDRGDMVIHVKFRLQVYRGSD